MSAPCPLQGGSREACAPRPGPWDREAEYTMHPLPWRMRGTVCCLGTRPCLRASQSSTTSVRAHGGDRGSSPFPHHQVGKVAVHENKELVIRPWGAHTYSVSSTVYPLPHFHCSLTTRSAKSPSIENKESVMTMRRAGLPRGACLASNCSRCPRSLWRYTCRRTAQGWARARKGAAAVQSGCGRVRQGRASTQYAMPWRDACAHAACVRAWGPGCVGTRGVACVGLRPGQRNWCTRTGARVC